MTRQLRELEVIEVLISQGAVIPCYRCRLAFTMEDVKAKNIQNEHLHEKNLGGPDEPGNRRFSHAARPCHATVTHGPPHTFAGSSRHKIAKANDPERKAKFVVQKPELDAEPWPYCMGCEQAIDPRQPHRCPKADARRADERARRLHTIHPPADRCRRCGEDSDLCRCAPLSPKSSFRQTPKPATA